MGKSNDVKSNNTGKIIGAAVAGVIIGGALGILFAPAKGSETRKNILSRKKSPKLETKDTEKLNTVKA